nr:MAG TPA: hypothetical protein [Caudoviricetes sp.]
MFSFSYVLFLLVVNIILNYKRGQYLIITIGYCPIVMTNY